MNSDDIKHKTEQRNEIIEEERKIITCDNEIEEKQEIRIYDDKIEEVAERMTEMGIGKEKAKTELKIMIMMGLMMNRHRAQE